MTLSLITWYLNISKNNHTFRLWRWHRQSISEKMDWRHSIANQKLQPYNIKGPRMVYGLLFSEVSWKYLSALEWSNGTLFSMSYDSIYWPQNDFMEPILHGLMGIFKGPMLDLRNTILLKVLGVLTPACFGWGGSLSKLNS